MMAEVTFTICGTCGHGHQYGAECPDHQWTDACPYVGLGCPTEDERVATIVKLDAAWESGRLGPSILIGGQ